MLFGMSEPGDGLRVPSRSFRVFGDIDTFKFPLPPNVNPGGLKVSVCPLMYDKKWAYSVEIDDGPTTTLTVTQPLLAKYSFTTAPPGIKGGLRMPFVGGAAIYPFRIGTENASFLNWDQVHELQSKGWSILNHSYWHSGYSWDPKGALSADRLRDEVFWSLSIIAAETPSGNAPTHFVFPNGYMEYKSVINKFGILSASRVAGNKLVGSFKDADRLDIDRNYLDESVWSNSANPLDGLPTNPKPEQMVIDFTHGTDGDPKSANYKRWIERLSWLERQFGSTGSDTMWCAPTDTVIKYRLAAAYSKVTITGHNLVVQVPHEFANSALTIKIVGANSKYMASWQRAIFDKHETTWWTTPVLTQRGFRPPVPRVKRFYKGIINDMDFNPPIDLAAIRIRQFGMATNAEMFVEIVDPKNVVTKLKIYNESTNWGVWHLIPIVPNKEAIKIKSIHLPKGTSFKELEIWTATDVPS